MVCKIRTSVMFSYDLIGWRSGSPVYSTSNRLNPFTSCIHRIKSAVTQTDFNFTVEKSENMTLNESSISALYQQGDHFRNDSNSIIFQVIYSSNKGKLFNNTGYQQMSPDIMSQVSKVTLKTSLSSTEDQLM